MFKRPKVMAILNVTPDSFSDGGCLDSLEAAIRRASEVLAAGADILDIGGESTRPKAKTISVAEELKRVMPLIKEIRMRHPGCVISIDSRKPEVAHAAIEAGADIWNDVSALTYAPQSLTLAARLQCPLILMHAFGPPETMQDNPVYEDVWMDIYHFFEERVAATHKAGIAADRLTLDVGMGFGKNQTDNLRLLRDMAGFQRLGHALLLGASRKSFIGRIDGSSAAARLGGSLAAALWGAQAGVEIVRVHDVAETVQALKVWEAIVNAS